MKTLTEFSGTVLRMAAPAVEKLRAGFTPAAVETPAEATEGEAAAAPAGESDEQRAALEAAINEATGISGDRAARLREALQLAEGRLADVRLVRVYGGETAPAGARTVGEHHFLIDLMPRTMAPSYARPEKEREGGRGKGRGGRDGKGRDGGKGREGAPRG